MSAKSSALSHNSLSSILSLFREKTVFQEKKKSGQFGLKLKTIAQDLLGPAIVLQYSALFRLSISSFGPAFLKACFVQGSAFNKTNNTVLVYCFVKTFSFPFSKFEVGSHVAQAGLILPAFRRPASVTVSYFDGFYRDSGY